MRRPMHAATCAVFFASGAAALLFETLWFRQTGLMLGNSVWASALVTAAFMAGLALGNAFAVRVGWKLTRPLRVFAALELVVGATGAALVLGMPRLAEAAAPALSRLQGSAALDALRLVSAFVLLALPASAMGATLPVLARSLGARDSNFGRLLGRLYGWNTLGAVAGALAGEVFLIRMLGVTGTAVFAAGLELLAATGALLLDRRQAPLPLAPRSETTLPSRATRIVAAAFLAGLLLLALEVVWFRLLLMFVWATSETFAIMLAIVLLGIGAGGLLASAWLGRHPGESQLASPLALAAGAATVLSYRLLERALPPPDAGRLDGWGTVLVSLWLMLPVCTASGALFTFLGHALRAEAAEDARAAGLLTLANTVGAMLGSLLAGFVLLPLVGMEVSLFLLACAYAGVAALTPRPSSTPQRRLRLAATGLFAVVLLLFPFGAMTEHFRRVAAWWPEGQGNGVASVKEGLSETVFLLRRDVLGQPLSFRLLTNGMGMSTTTYSAQRYMGLFVWLPLALHPEPRSALLISYGLGNTARALTATSELTRIDVVDVSPDVLRMSPLVWSEAPENPLRDPRVRVHIEDGRFFLLASSERYDLITGEPPPPKSAGIVSLYSREYFRLMRERLAEGGIASYWLPVLHLDPREAFAVTRGFCDAFEDCSLWTGFGHEWMLLGTRAARGPVSGERFARQWSDPVVAPRLRAAGLDSPSQLGATFLADAVTLATHTAGVAPLVDDYPHRLDPRRRLIGSHPSVEYAQLMYTDGARSRFQASPFVRRLWPPEWVARSLPAFETQTLVNRVALLTESILPITLADQEEALATGTEVLALWSLGSSVEQQSVFAKAGAGGFTGPELLEQQGLQALVRHRYAEAESLLAGAEPHLPHASRLRRFRILAADLAGDRARAMALLGDAGDMVRADRSPEDVEAWRWLARRFELP